MSEPLQNGEFATKVVKDSITEIKVAMPKELSRSIRFTASAHAYSWVTRKEKAEELIAWLKEHGFQNIQTSTPVVEGEGVEANVSSGVFTTVTATATAVSNDNPTCPVTFECNSCRDSSKCNSSMNVKITTYYNYGVYRYGATTMPCFWANNRCYANSSDANTYACKL